MAKGAGCWPPAWPPCWWSSPRTPTSTPAALDAALREATRVTFDRADSDGCMSTNDTVVLLASGASGAVPDRRRSAPG